MRIQLRQSLSGREASGFSPAALTTRGPNTSSASYWLCRRQRREMFATLAEHPEIRGFTWLDYDKETDWRVASSQSSVSSFAAGLATYR